jgi:hypothetical protein
LFSLHPDSSTLMPFIPLLFLALIKAVRRYRIQRKDLIGLGVLNLLLSMWWVRLNVSGMEEGFLSGETAGFPAQRYWMHFGNEQSLGVYGVVLVLGLLLLFVVERRRRRYVRSGG